MSGLLAAVPAATLLGLVLSGRVTARAAAAVSLALALVLAATAFEAPAVVVGVGLAKGAWLALWILLVVLLGLLLFRLVDSVGSRRIGDALSRLLPTREQRLLALAWVFPSFIQGVAGFGTPIAVAAPLLLALGWSPVRAVALPLVGYHWSVTFGSMGSSFYVASLTAGLPVPAQDELALRAAAVLAVNCLAAGSLVLLLDGGLARLRAGIPTLLPVGAAMAATLVAVAAQVPAVASLAAGGVGLLLLWLMARTHTSRDLDVEAVTEHSPLLLLSPYAVLLLLALPAFLVPASRAWITDVLVVAPAFPASETGRGWVNAPVEAFTPLAPLAHPASFIALASLAGYLVYRRSGLLDRGGARTVLAGWVRGIPAASLPILLLSCLAMVMVESGMIAELAEGAARLAGDGYPVVAPLLGALGSFMTGSTTSSNALFAALQAQVGALIEVDPTILVAAQTAGGNVGNALAPVVVLVGVSATAGATGGASVSRVMRLCLAPIAALLALVVLSTAAMIVLA